MSSAPHAYVREPMPSSASDAGVLPARAPAIGSNGPPSLLEDLFQGSLWKARARRRRPEAFHASRWSEAFMNAVAAPAMTAMVAEDAMDRGDGCHGPDGMERPDRAMPQAAPIGEWRSHRGRSHRRVASRRVVRRRVARRPAGGAAHAERMLRRPHAAAADTCGHGAGAPFAASEPVRGALKRGDPDAGRRGYRRRQQTLAGVLPTAAAAARRPAPPSGEPPLAASTAPCRILRAAAARPRPRRPRPPPTRRFDALQPHAVIGDGELPGLPPRRPAPPRDRPAPPARPGAAVAPRGGSRSHSWGRPMTATPPPPPLPPLPSLPTVTSVATTATVTATPPRSPPRSPWPAAAAPLGVPALGPAVAGEAAPPPTPAMFTFRSAVKRPRSSLSLGALLLAAEQDGPLSHGGADAEPADRPKRLGSQATPPVSRWPLSLPPPPPPPPPPSKADLNALLLSRLRQLRTSGSTESLTDPASSPSPSPADLATTTTTTAATDAATDAALHGLLPPLTPRSFSLPSTGAATPASPHGSAAILSSASAPRPFPAGAVPRLSPPPVRPRRGAPEDPMAVAMRCASSGAASDTSITTTTTAAAAAAAVDLSLDRARDDDNDDSVDDASDASEDAGDGSGGTDAPRGEAEIHESIRRMDQQIRHCMEGQREQVVLLAALKQQVAARQQHAERLRDTLVQWQRMGCPPADDAVTAFRAAYNDAIVASDRAHVVKLGIDNTAETIDQLMRNRRVQMAEAAGRLQRRAPRPRRPAPPPSLLPGTLATAATPAAATIAPTVAVLAATPAATWPDIPMTPDLPVTQFTTLATAAAGPIAGPPATRSSNSPSAPRRRRHEDPSARRAAIEAAPAARDPHATPPASA
ncbi:hypothetical protein CXG81DRAFT_16614 [Caulochytrium protostelioides]|uniref:Uncharacterized protein n=1 Tax=Caulochytrium protostelioides TaxID=1555241 RepID=A0A4P9XEG7_9FUNG|nr:hypothetical protein CXG81DRAFT_16614 [Caulochytrium protostelioides]|eukprot:RKP03908.1 hypothetical protein CXG81DRAFT_16614 [Caulochytrium protostelioides]